MVNSKLRKSAHGEDCTVRIPGICNWNPETVVLAHLRRGWNSGGGMKPHDTHAVYACSACHEYIGDVGPRAPADVHMAVLDAILRTHDRMREKGLL